MKRYEVVLCAGVTSAGAQGRGVVAGNRPKARDPFDDEMAAVLDRLAEAPKTGLAIIQLLPNFDMRPLLGSRPVREASRGRTLSRGSRPARA